MIGAHASALAAQLPDLGDALSAAMAELHPDPHADRAEMMAVRLSAASRHCQHLAEAIRQERGNGQ